MLNHSFKVVYNRATGCFTAVAEYARSRGKTKSTALSGVAGVRGAGGFGDLMMIFRLKALVAALLMLGGGQVLAATGDDITVSGTNVVTNGTGANQHLCYFDTGTDSIICGGDNTETNDDKAIAIGGESGAGGAPLRSAAAYGDGSIALGAGSVAGTKGVPVGVDTGNVAIGDYATANKQFATAIGTGALATSTNASVSAGNFALGNNARANTLDVAIGGAALNSTAVGDSTNMGSLGYNVAVGSGAGQNVQEKTQYSTFVGYQSGSLSSGKYNTFTGNKSGAGFNGDGNIAIGIDTGASATGDNNTFSGQNAGKNYGFATNASGLPTAPVASSHSVAAGTAALSYSQGQKNVAQGYGAGAGIKGDNNIAIGTAAGTNQVFLGNSIDLSDGGSTAIGNIRAFQNTVAVGNQAKAFTNESIAIGNEAVAGKVDADPTKSTTQAIAIGDGAQALGVQSISIGTGNIVKAKNSGAIGDPTTIDATGVSGTAVDGSYSIGNDNHINSSDTFILGNSVNKDGTTDYNSVKNSVYLGKDSHATAGTGAVDAATGKGTLYTKNSTDTAGIAATTAGDEGAVSSATVGGTTYSGFAGATAHGVVTVGAAGNERRIQNVAAGEVSSTSTDVINGSQLYAVAQELDRKNHFHVNNSGSAADAAALAAAQGNTSNLADVDGVGGAKGWHSTAAGVKAQAEGSRSTALGYKSNAEGTSSVALGESSNAKGGNSIAIGADSTANTAYSTAIGRESDAAGQGAFALGGGTTGNAAVANGTGSVAIGGYGDASHVGAKTNAKYAVAVGSGSSASKQDAVALGSNSVAERGVLTSPVADVSGNPITGIGIGGAGKTVFAPKGSVAAATSAITDTVKGDLGAVSVGNKDATRQIVNVAAGSEDTDAVNVAQLRAASQPWRLKQTGGTENEINPADTVEFEDGDNTTVTVTDEASGVTKVKYEVKTTALADTDANGAIDAPTAANTTKLVNAGDVATAINASGFKLDIAGNTSSDVTTGSKGYELVNPGDTLTIEGGNNVTVSQNKGTIKIVTNNQAIAENAQLPVVYTDASGNKVYKHTDGNFYTAPNGGGVQVPTANVIASMQNADGSTTAPTALTNVASTLPNTYSTTAGGNTITTMQALPDTLNPTSANFNPNQLNRAATVGDVLNSGWNLQTGASAVDFVKPYETVNFEAGDGLSVNGTSDGATSKVTYALNYDANVFKIDNGKLTLKDSTLAVTNTSTSVTAANGTTTTTGGGAGGNLTVEAGKNLDASLDVSNNTIKLSTADNVTFDKVTVNTGLTVGNGAKVNMGDNVVSSVSSGLVDTNGNPVSIANASGDTLTNAANIGDLQKVQSSVSNVSVIVGSSGDLASDQLALKTYNPVNQGEKINNTVISAITNMNEGGIKYFHTNDTKNSYATSQNNTEDSQAGGAYSTAVGYRAKSDGESALAIGNGAQAVGTNAISIGTGNIVNGNNSGAIGDPSTINGANSYSVGNTNTVDGSISQGAFVLGNNVNAKVDNSVYLGNKTNATAGAAVGTVGLKSDGTTGTTTTAGDTGTVTSATVGGVTYGGFAGATANGVVSVGASGTERRVQNVAAGEISATSTDAVNGSQLYITNKILANSVSQIATNSAGIAQNAGNIANNTVAISKNAGSIANNTAAINKGVNFGDGSTSNNYALGSTINVVGDGNVTSKTTDTGVQVGLANKITLGDKQPVTIDGDTGRISGLSDGEVNPDSTEAVNGSQLYQTNQAVGNMANALDDLGYRVDENKEQANAGVSQAMAMAALPQAYLPGKSMLSGGMATYNGQGAVAIGVSKLSDNGRWVMKFNGSADTKGNAGAAVGAGFHW